MFASVPEAKRDRVHDGGVHAIHDGVELEPKIPP